MSFKTCVFDALDGTGVRRTVLLASCPAWFRAAPPCVVPIRSARDMFGFWTRQVQFSDTPCMKRFPDMPCLKKFTGIKRRRSTSRHLGTKSASRPGDKLVTNRLSTGDFVPAFGLHRVSLVRASGGTFRRCVHDALEGTRDAYLLGRLLFRRPVLTDAAPPPPCAPTRPARGMFGFWTRQVCTNTELRYVQTCRIQNTDIPRASRGGAADGGLARQGETRQFGTPTDRSTQETSVHLALKGIKDNCPERLLERTNKAKPM